MAFTVIQVQKTTLERLKDRKLDMRMSYDKIINVLLDQTQEELTAAEMKEVKRGLEDIEAGRVISHEALMKKYKLKS